MSQPLGTIPPSATEAAVDWLVRLSSGAADDSLQVQFRHWLEADAVHQAAWAALSRSMAGFDELHHLTHQKSGQTKAVHQALSSSKISMQRRKFLGKGVAVVVMGVGTGYLANRFTPLAHFTADYVTATGERRNITLADGSRVQINARSALDIRYTDKERLLQLHAGECMVEVASDPLRPLLLQTPHGVLEAKGGCRLLAGLEGGRSFAMVQQGALNLVSRQGSQAIMEAGEAAWFDKQAIERKAANIAARAAWIHGMLDVRDQSLAEVVESLRVYHRGWIRVSPQAASLRVFGMFRLDDIGQALYSLQAVLPVSIRRYGNLLTMIDLI
ncbi:FecR domain-containing protein [Methylobacillus arboreus]|uniref:FecR family protein n=1 Tax=Methylobacillus arboreus TaxID=755170 RepID=UPI001E38A867|nr:FecR domain-containing protein [Methylobacillus arboreus]MCB5190932.1 FecR domain-containing protein [Methylobacillus arboreus]